MAIGRTDAHPLSSGPYNVGGAQARAKIQLGTTRGDPAQQANTSLKVDNQAQQTLHTAAPTSTRERKLNQLLGTDYIDKQSDTDAATKQSVLDRVGKGFRNTFGISELPRSSPTSSPRSTQSAGASLENAQFKRNTTEALKAVYASGKIGDEQQAKLEFCKELLRQLGVEAGKFVREKSEEMYKQVTNAQSIGRGNTAYSALATAYLEQKLNFTNSEVYKNLEKALKDPANEITLELANDLWKETFHELKSKCLADPELNLFLQQLYSSHLDIFTRGANGNEDLKDTQMKKDPSVTAEQCAAKMVSNTLFLRVICPAIAKLNGNDLAKIFQNGTNLFVKAADPTALTEKAVAHLNITKSFIDEHKTEILEFGRMFAPQHATSETAQPTPATSNTSPKAKRPSQPAPTAPKTVRTPPQSPAPAPPSAFDKQLSDLSKRIDNIGSKEEIKEISAKLEEMLEKVDPNNSIHIKKLEAALDKLAAAKASLPNSPRENAQG